MSLSHIIILGIIMLIVIPPEKLPEAMRNIARVFNEIRRSTTGVWDDIKRDAALRPEDIFKHQANQHAHTTEHQQNAIVEPTVSVSANEHKEEIKDGSKPEST